MDKVLRFTALRKSSCGVPSMRVEAKGDYVRYKDYLKLKRELKTAYGVIVHMEDEKLDAINPCCD